MCEEVRWELIYSEIESQPPCVTLTIAHRTTATNGATTTMGDGEKVSDQTISAAERVPWPIRFNNYITHDLRN